MRVISDKARRIQSDEITRFIRYRKDNNDTRDNIFIKSGPLSTEIDYLLRQETPV